MADSKQSSDQAFQIQLLSKTLDQKRYPFTKLIIERNVTKQEYENLFCLLEQLNDRYQKQKEAGLLDYTSLLIHFAGMLNEKLQPNETIYALKKEGYFPSLMDEFIHILKESQTKIGKC